MYMWSSSGQRRECGGQRALTRQRLDEVPTAKLQEDLGVETRAKRVEDSVSCRAAVSAALLP